MSIEEPFMERIPVLLIGFNRPEHIRTAMLKLIELGVKNLYISLDGPRGPSDKANCINTFKQVEKLKDNFNSKVVYRQSNLGCCLAVVAALDWFYSQVDFGVILEDDCIPEKGVFEFFQDFQSKSRVYDGLRILIASAHNPLGSLPENLPTKHVFIHGWATAARTWQTIRKDFFAIALPSKKNRLGGERSSAEAVYWWANATRARLGKVDTWDGIFYDRVWKLGIKTLLPRDNLIKNIGYGNNSTHTVTERALSLKIPNNMLLTGNIDQYLKKHYFGIRYYHLFKPFFRVFLDLIQVRKKIDFELKLTHDRIERIELT
jgi:hypothetical protein